MKRDFMVSFSLKTLKKLGIASMALATLLLFQNCESSPPPVGTSSTGSSSLPDRPPVDAPSGTSTCKLNASGIVNPVIDCAPAAICDGSTDDTDIFQSAMAVVNSAGGTLQLPSSRSCVVNKTLNIERSRVGIVCAGGDLSCILQMNVGNVAQVSATKVFPGVEGINIRGIAFLRKPGVAVEGGDGLDFSGWVDGSTIENVKVDGSFNDIILGPTSISRVKNIWLFNAVRDNLVLRTNNGQNGSILQWDLDAVGSGGAGRFGIFVTNEGTSEEYTILGDWRNIQTYINGQGSIWIQAIPGHSINDLRLDRGWICCSKAGAYEIYLNMAGGENNSISDSTVEIGNGVGIAVDGTTKHISISDTRVNGCAGAGIYGGATQQISLSNVSAINNGLKSTASGVFITNGKATIANLKSTGNTGYGLFLNATTLLMSTGDLTGNSQGALGGTVDSTNANICAVLGVDHLCGS